VTRFGLEAAEARYAQAARQIGFAQRGDPDAVAAERLAEGLAGLNCELEVPTPAAFGIDKREWDAKLDLMADQALASGSPANNPRVPSKAEIIALYQVVWSGNSG
jgi:alcohol dehydrogenase class IV